jgi:hypothetical protein
VVGEYAGLDVTDNLDDPDFVMAFQVISYSYVMVGGRLVKTAASPVDRTGSVQPANTRDLQRLADLSRYSGGIVIFSKLDFTVEQADPDNGGGTLADVVLYAGRRYTVMQTEPWFAGPGYVRALAALDTVS